jgi:ABC-type nitrate/sulfonate/bicarbonate transport system substrate-binding protein
MQNGSVQAGSVGVQTRRAFQKGGFYEMVDVGKLGVSYPSGWPVMSRKWFDAHTDMAQRYMKAILQAMAWEQSHHEETVRILARTLKTDDMDLVRDDFDLGMPRLRKAPYPDLAGVKTALEEIGRTNPDARTADPNRFVEPRFVKTLDDSGFIASLYR